MPVNRQYLITFAQHMFAHGILKKRPKVSGGDAFRTRSLGDPRGNRCAAPWLSPSRSRVSLSLSEARKCNYQEHAGLTVCARRHTMTSLTVRLSCARSQMTL